MATSLDEASRKRGSTRFGAAVLDWFVCAATLLPVVDFTVGGHAGFRKNRSPRMTDADDLFHRSSK
jgi:hypothetical protein